MSNYDIYIISIVLVKIGFIGLAATHLYLKHTGKTNSKKDNNVLFWKERFEFIFIISLAFICIIVFCPFYGDIVFIDKHTRILLFIYGFIIILQEFGVLN